MSKRALKYPFSLYVSIYIYIGIIIVYYNSKTSKWKIV